jgi:hypothetical protein
MPFSAGNARYATRAEKFRALRCGTARSALESFGLSWFPFPPNRFPSNSQVFPSVPKRSQMISKQFPNDSQTFPKLCLIDFALNTWLFSEEYHVRLAKYFCRARARLSALECSRAFLPSNCQANEKNDG